jgi:hypothetical protein
MGSDVPCLRKQKKPSEKHVVLSQFDVQCNADGLLLSQQYRTSLGMFLASRFSLDSVSRDASFPTSCISLMNVYKGGVSSLWTHPTMDLNSADRVGLAAAAAPVLLLAAALLLVLLGVCSLAMEPRHLYMQVRTRTWSKGQKQQGLPVG